MSERPEIVTVLLPEDEYTHEPDAASNYNESMYLNGFDLEQGLGAWFRLGNRVNEGYAEMSVCLYLPDGRVGFMFGRPKIETNDAMHAGGLEIAVVTPFEHLTISCDGKVVVLDEPEQTVVSSPLTIFPKPMWFSTHRCPEAIARKLIRLYLQPTWWRLPSLLINAMRG